MLNVEGMTCASCDTAVEIALRKNQAVLEAKVSFEEKEAIVKNDPTAVQNVEWSLLESRVMSVWGVPSGRVKPCQEVPMPESQVPRPSELARRVRLPSAAWSPEYLASPPYQMAGFQPPTGGQSWAHADIHNYLCFEYLTQEGAFV